MLTYVCLKALADLTIYDTFAAFVASYFRVDHLLFFPAMLIQALAFGLSYLADRKRGGGFRFLPLLAVLAPVVFPFSGVPMAFRIAQLPPAGYLLFLGIKHRYEPNWTRQAGLLSVFWKAYLIAIVFLSFLLGAAERVVQTMFPLGMMAFLILILLTRTLRHEPSVYLSPSCQLLNLLSVGALGGLSLLLGRGGELYRQLLSMLLGLFSYLLIPVGYVADGISRWLFSDIGEFNEEWMQTVFPSATAQATQAPLPEATTPSGAMPSVVESGPDYRPLILLLVAVAATILLLRAVSRVKLVHRGRSAIRETRGRTDRPAPRWEKDRQSSAVSKIRAQYKKYLRLLNGRRVVITPSQTSQDINVVAQNVVSGEAVDSLRSLYIAARYAGKADKDGAKLASELYEEIRRAAVEEERLRGDVRPSGDR